MTVGIGGFAPFSMNSVFCQSHYPWSSDPSVLFCIVADRRFLFSGDTTVGFQTLTQNQVLQKAAAFAVVSVGGGSYVAANDWGSKNLGSIMGDGTTQVLETANAAINAYGAGTNTSYTVLSAVQFLSAAGARHAYHGWSNPGKPVNDLAFEGSDIASPTHYQTLRAGDVGGFVTATTTQTIDGNKHALCWVFDGSGPTQTIYIDGVVSSVNATPLSVGDIVDTVYTIWGTNATGIGNFTKLRTRTVLVIKGVVSADRRDAYTRFMLDELN